MEALKAWFKEKNYNEGIILLKKYSKNDSETEFLNKNTDDPQKMHFALMEKRFSTILRIYGQKLEEKQGVKSAIQFKTETSTPIIDVKRIHYSEVDKKLEKRIELTNKLLSYTWNDMNDREKAYFKNDQSFFEAKKELLIQNSAIESDLKSQHAALHHAKDDNERKIISENLVYLKKKQTSNWKQIDDFENFNVEKVAKKVASSDIDKADLIQKRNNLRSRRAKLEKQVQENEHPNYKKRLQSYNQVIKELSEIEENLK